MIFECTVNVLCIYMKSSEKLTILMSARNTYYPILKKLLQGRSNTNYELK